MSSNLDSEDGPRKSIMTEFETEEEPVDHGVEKEVTATEDYVYYGEQIERETELAILEDGGVHITQKVEDQNIFDSLTLGEDVVRRLVQEVEE